MPLWEISTVFVNLFVSLKKKSSVPCINASATIKSAYRIQLIEKMKYKKRQLQMYKIFIAILFSPLGIIIKPIQAYFTKKGENFSLALAWNNRSTAVILKWILISVYMLYNIRFPLWIKSAKRILHQTFGMQ